MYADNQSKFVAVLNKKVALPTLLNALGHMAAGLASSPEQREQMEFLCYEDADAGIHPNISKFPFIILSAKNGNQLRTFRQQLLELELPYTDFTGSMLGSSAQDQLEKTAACPEAELEYFGVCTFGSADQLDLLTKKFSLFSSQT